MEEKKELVPPEKEKEEPQNCDDESLNDIEEIPEELIEIVEDEGIDSASKVRRIKTSLALYSGPLPPPSMFAAYKEVLDDAPERIMVLAEKEQDHRHTMNFSEGEIRRSLVESDINRANKGLLFGFLLFILFMGVSLTLFLTGNETAGYITFFTNIGGIIVNFIRVGRERKDNP